MEQAAEIPRSIMSFVLYSSWAKSLDFDVVMTMNNVSWTLYYIIPEVETK